MVYSASTIALRSPEEIDLSVLNALARDPYFLNTADSVSMHQPLEDVRQLFVKQIILEDGTKVEVETVKVPGFIGIADEPHVTDPKGNFVSGYADIAQLLHQDGILICVYQWHRDLYGIPVDLRSSLSNNPNLEFQTKETILKNDGNHAFAIVPAPQLDHQGQQIAGFATLDQPGGTCYRNTFFDNGNNGRIAVAQRLLFPDYVAPEQARGYVNSMINWMILLNACVESPPDFNSDRTKVVDRATLQEFLRTAALACLGEREAIDFLRQPENANYCSEFIYICLNTVLYPFNPKGLMQLLNDEAKVDNLLALKQQYNQQQRNRLSIWARSPKIQSCTIPMPPVLDSLVPLDHCARQHHPIESGSLPFLPWQTSQLLDRVCQTLLPDSKFSPEQRLQAQTQLLKRIADLNSSEEGKGKDYHYVVPPRLFVDRGQPGYAETIPGWGFKLETVGALIYQGVFQLDSPLP